jgi:hypothetical protein
LIICGVAAGYLVLCVLAACVHVLRTPPGDPLLCVPPKSKPEEERDLAA